MSVARAVGPKIAYVCADPGVPVFGRKGSSIHVQEVVRALTRSGAQVELFAMRFDGEPSPDLAHIPRHQLPPVGKGDAAQREQAALGVNDALYRALAAAGPFDFVYERYSLWSYAGMEFAAATKIPGLLEVNAPLIEEQAQHRSLVNRAGAEEVARRTFGAATALLAVSDDVAAYLESFPAAAGRIHVLDPQRAARLGVRLRRGRLFHGRRAHRHTASRPLAARPRRRTPPMLGRGARTRREARCGPPARAASGADGRPPCGGSRPSRRRRGSA